MTCRQPFLLASRFAASAAVAAGLLLTAGAALAQEAPASSKPSDPSIEAPASCGIVNKGGRAVAVVSRNCPQGEMAKVVAQASALSAAESRAYGKGARTASRGSLTRNRINDFDGKLALNKISLAKSIRQGGEPAFTGWAPAR